MVRPLATVRRQYINIIVCAGLCSAFTWKEAYAYDDDRSISQVDFNKESFLDINAASFRRSLEPLWLASENGFRMAGGSISSNRLALNSELKLNQSMSEHLMFTLDWQQDDFYSDKPTPLPELAIKAFPASDTDLGLAVIGSAAHDKRQADLGYALLWGREVDDQLRLSWQKIDIFHNEKNEFDDAFYTESGETLTFEGVKRINPQWLIDFRFERDRPLSLSFDEGAGRFDHKRYAHEFAAYYTEHTGALTGLRWQAFDVAKTRRDDAENQAQWLDYLSLDLFRVIPTDADKELTFGLRYDQFRERRHDRSNPDDSFNYCLDTSQLYFSLHQELSAHQAWDLGVYAGWHKQSRAFAGEPSGDLPEEHSEGMESKLKGSWEYGSADKKSVLRISLSLNLDDPVNDPGDGGGIYYFSIF